jgi:hypothetical protein
MRLGLAAAVLACVAFIVWTSTPTSTHTGGTPRRLSAEERQRLLDEWERHFTPVSRGPGPPPWRAPLLEKTIGAQKRFRLAGIDSYRVTIHWYCLCLVRGAGQARAFEVTVRNQRIVELTALRNDPTGSRARHAIGTYDHVPDRYDWVKQWVPVEQMYDRIAGTSTDVDDVQVRFGRRTGAPKLYSVDPQLGAFDDELTIVWSDFERLD